MNKKHSFLHSALTFKKAISPAIFVLWAVLLPAVGGVNAQSCTYVNGIGCPNTDYNNSFMNSGTNAATIEYDNWVSTFHSTMIRRTDGQFMVWGERLANDGVSHLLSPQLIDSAHYPALGANKVLKVTGASKGIDNCQFFALVTDGLYAWGVEGLVIDSNLTSSPGFQKLTSLNGNGLPPGINPADVKMMTATFQSLFILTCSGEVWVLGVNYYTRGDISAISNLAWSRVRANTVGTPVLSNIVAVRASTNIVMALRSDNTMWTWGNYSLLGDNSPATLRMNAAQMTNPAAGSVKMIAAMGFGVVSYYVLMADNSLYTMGWNSNSQLGDWTGLNTISWIRPRYDSASGPVMNNIRWISVNDHDSNLPSVNVLTTAGMLYSFGVNARYMIGQPDPLSSNNNPAIPNGVSSSDVILGVSSGGHTSMLAKCNTVNFGYVGHRINGSMGNGSNADVEEASYTFLTAGVPICGIQLAEIKANPSVLPQYGTAYGVTQSVPILTYPSGGTISLVSGAAILTGNTVTFNHSGTVVLSYTYTNIIGAASCTTTSQLSLTVRNGTLPLTLVAFTARNTDCNTDLYWETADEQNTSYFEIQQSEDGRSWKTAGKLAAHGTGPGWKYNFKTTQDIAVMFYRLKMADISGSFIYSNVIVSQNKCKSSSPVILLYPNPAKNTDYVNVTIYGSQGGRAILSVISTLGAKVITKDMLLTGSPVSEKLNIRNLAAGTYIIRLTDDKGILLGTAQKLIRE